MSTVTFYLKKNTGKAEASVMLAYLKNGKRFRYSTKLKVNPKYWLDNKVKSQCEGAEEINSLSNGYVEDIRKIEREALFLKKDYGIEIIKRKFESKNGKLNAENDFFKSYDIFIEQSKPIRTLTTIKTYTTTKNMLLKFQSEKKIQITFESITNEFYEKFVDFLIAKKYLNNTIGKHIKTLKTFLNYSKDHEFTNISTNLKKFKVLQEDIDIVYLTDGELMKIYNLSDLSPALEKVKDCFCFGCFTGLRFSHINQLTHANYHNNYIEFRTEKTKDSLKIPLNDYAREIIVKYKNNSLNKLLPTGISNQKTNDYLKIICEHAELNDVIESVNYSGSKKIITKTTKHQLITTHTARRTFVTLALEKGIRAEVVMAMTGHKSYKTFKKYIKITDTVMHTEMIKAWQKPLLIAV